MILEQSNQLAGHMNGKFVQHRLVPVYMCKQIDLAELWKSRGWVVVWSRGFEGILLYYPQSISRTIEPST